MSLASIFSFLFFVVKSLHVQQIEEQDVTLFANWVMKLVKMSLYWINIGPKSSNLHPYKTNVIHTEGDHVTQSQRERCSNKPINVKDTRSLQKLEEERNFFFFLGTFIGKNGTAYILFWTSSLQKCENKFCHSKPSFPKLCYGHLRKLMHPLQSRYFQHKRGYVKFLCNTEVITF